MHLETRLEKYILNYKSSIGDALTFISSNKCGFIIAVDNNGIFKGTLTDGDIRRWLINTSHVDLNTCISGIYNTNCVTCHETTERNILLNLLSDQIKFIPIINSHRKLISIAINAVNTLNIAGKVISEKSPTFIIAEIGNNHNGNFNLAKKLVDSAKECAVDCVKFQMRQLDDIYSNINIPQDLGSEYTIDLLKKFQLSNDQLFQIFDYCKEIGVIPLCTPWDSTSFNFLKDYGMDAYKISSADMTNHQLVASICESNKPVLISTGMWNEAEIINTVNLLTNTSAQYALLHCNSTYPTPFKDINLSYLSRLKEIGNNCIIGYSGHERGFYIPLAAVALGARIIEKHFTLDKNAEGNDHKVSLLPLELKEMVTAIRQIDVSIGRAEKKVSQGELINREVLAKSVVTRRKIKKGAILTSEDLSIQSPGSGLSPYKMKYLIGRTIKRDMNQGDVFYESDLSGFTEEYHFCNFGRPYGLPVRYHDLDKMIEITNLSLVEFHLSYKDLSADLNNIFIKDNYSQRYLVHAPELFENDHILDLTSNNETYRNISIGNLQRVIDVTNSLRKFFPEENRPQIIVNVGGFSMDTFLSKSVIEEKYMQLRKSIKELDLKGIELLPQTMPPFPWHFGGQRYHNLFTTPEFIDLFLQHEDTRICLDISHSKLTCNYYKIPFLSFLEKVLPYTSHIHIADASGIDGEGLQIGDGEIDFKAFFQLLKNYKSNATFIPEVWQGHKNNGEGFLKALKKLETQYLVSGNN